MDVTPTQTAGLKKELDAVESTAFNFGVRFIPDSRVRAQYLQQTRAMSREILDQVDKMQISLEEGVQRATALRNLIMNTLRGKTSEIAQAYAFKLKKYGTSLSELQEKYANRLFSKPFGALSENMRNKVWREIVFSAGQPRTEATRLAKILGRAGKGFIALTVIIAVYDVTTAKNKQRAIAKETAVISGGLAGSLAGAALAGLACGPGAPVCVGIGIFVVGTMFALGSDYAFDSFWN